jgi:hypothetical protein
MTTITGNRDETYTIQSYYFKRKNTSQLKKIYFQCLKNKVVFKKVHGIFEIYGVRTYLSLEIVGDSESINNGTRLPEGATVSRPALTLIS